MAFNTNTERKRAANEAAAKAAEDAEKKKSKAKS